MYEPLRGLCGGGYLGPQWLDHYKNCVSSLREDMPKKKTYFNGPISYIYDFLTLLKNSYKYEVLSNKKVCKVKWYEPLKPGVEHIN